MAPLPLQVSEDEVDITAMRAQGATAVLHRMADVLFIQAVRAYTEHERNAGGVLRGIVRGLKKPWPAGLESRAISTRSAPRLVLPGATVRWPSG